MSPYRHTQPGTVVRWALLAPLLALVALPLMPVPWPVLGPLMGLVAAIGAVSVVLLWSLTIEVTPAHFKFWFGPGLIGKTLPVARIVSCTPVDGLWAWGIHWAGKRGWLYNVSGHRAVALRLSDGKALMVGTDEPERLCEAVAQARAGFTAGEQAY